MSRKSSTEPAVKAVLAASNAVDTRSLDALRTALDSSRLNPVDVCCLAEKTVEDNWPQGLALFAEICGQDLASSTYWLSRSLRRAARNPTLLSTVLAAASPQRAGRRRFFSSDGHTIALAASLCMSRDRDALRAILEKMAPGAMEDLREVLASGSMRRSFLKALRTRVHIAGTLPEDCLDFMAVHLKWNRGATVAVVAAFMDSGDAPPSFPLERWQAFLARHPERAQDYAADLTTPRERNRMLRAVETLVPEPGVQAWLCDMAVRLAAPPAPRPAPRRRTVASEADMEDRLAATWASLRLESGPAQSAPRRRA